MAAKGASPNQSITTQVTSWFVRNVIFPLWIRRDHPAFPRYFRDCERTQFLSKTELHALQLQRLRKLLQHARERCSFYADRMKQAGVDANENFSFDQFARLPVLTKRDIQDHGSAMQAQGFPENQRKRNQTGGSTGSPLQFYVDTDRFDSRKASTVRHDLWAGLRPGDWRISLWGARLDQLPSETWWDHLRNDLLYRVVALNTSKIKDEDWSGFIAEIRRRKPAGMVAYTQAAVAFARYLCEHHIDDIQIKSIVTTAEMLLPGQREFLESTFGGTVFNRYGCREVSVIASECEYHTGMHVNADALLVEILSDAATSSNKGRIVVTDLLNYSMPLIRYEIGDVGEWTENQQCPCGRQLPLLSDVHGRITDFLVLSDGRQISGPSLTLVISDMAAVRQVQFVQRSPQSVVLRVVPGKEYGPATEQELHKRLNLYFEGRAELQIETTDSIASERSGKYGFVVHEKAIDRT